MFKLLFHMQPDSLFKHVLAFVSEDVYQVYREIE